MAVQHGYILIGKENLNMKKKHIISLIIILIITGVYVLLQITKQDTVDEEQPQINSLTKDEAYSLLKEFYLDENDVLIFINETENEFIFEQKGSCKFAKCEYHINKETKEVYTFTEEKDNFN